MRPRIIAGPIAGARPAGDGRLPVWMCAVVIVGVSGGVYALLFRLLTALW